MIPFGFMSLQDQPKLPLGSKNTWILALVGILSVFASGFAAALGHFAAISKVQNPFAGKPGVENELLFHPWPIGNRSFTQNLHGRYQAFFLERADPIVKRRSAATFAHVRSESFFGIVRFSDVSQFSIRAIKPINEDDAAGGFHGSEITRSLQRVKRRPSIRTERIRPQTRRDGRDSLPA